MKTHGTDETNETDKAFVEQLLRNTEEKFAILLVPSQKKKKNEYILEEPIETDVADFEESQDRC